MYPKPRTLPYNRNDLLIKLRQIRDQMVKDWSAGAAQRKKDILADLDRQIAKMKECKKRIQASDTGTGFKVYVSFYDGEGPGEIRWPAEKPRDFFPLEYGIRQLEMSSARIVRLRDDDSIVRILAGDMKF